MEAIKQSLAKIFPAIATHGIIAFLKAAILLAIFIPCLKILVHIIDRILRSKTNAHIAVVVSKFVWYIGLSIIAIATLNELGFSLSMIIGTAGVIGVALGFAAQTSMANLISGLFLLCENAFHVGDIISCVGIMGTVVSLDLSSITLRTINNTLVRIPHETIIKNPVTNITRQGNYQLEFMVRMPVQYLDRAEQMIQEALQRTAGIENNLEHAIWFRAIEPPTTIYGAGQTFSIDPQLVIAVRFHVPTTERDLIQKRFVAQLYEIARQQEILLTVSLPSA